MLRVIDKSDLDGATFLADFSGHVLCPQMCRLPHIYDMNSPRWILNLVRIFTAYSWNGWAVREKKSAARVPATVTETALNREGFVAEGNTGNDRSTDGGKEGISVNSGGQEGAHGVVDGRDDDRRVEVGIDVSNGAMAQGQDHTGRQDLQGKDTWFDPQRRAMRNSTSIARLRSACVCVIVKIIGLLVIES